MLREFRDNPKELMQALDRFLSVYYGDRQIEYKPDLDEIASWNIPQPLKDLYSFVGKYPGKNGHSLRSQDSLFFNSGEVIEKEKIIFVAENQAVWFCGTESEGIDPPVWVIENVHPWVSKESYWIPVCDSLSQFLVTFCLKEAIFSSRYCYSAGLGHMISTFKAQGYEVATWQGEAASKAFFNEIDLHSLPSKTYFFIIEDAILISSDGWCGTNYKNANRLLTSISPESTKINMNYSLS